MNYKEWENYVNYKELLKEVKESDFLERAELISKVYRKAYEKGFEDGFEWSVETIKKVNKRRK